MRQDNEITDLYKDLYVGCTVLIYDDPQTHLSEHAIVTRVNSDSIDCMAIIGGRTASLRPFADCWHKDDPRCKTKPAVFKSRIRGCFELSEVEQSRVAVIERLAALETLVAEIVNA